MVQTSKEEMPHLFDGISAKPKFGRVELSALGLKFDCDNGQSFLFEYCDLVRDFLTPIDEIRIFTNEKPAKIISLPLDLEPKFIEYAPQFAYPRDKAKDETPIIKKLAIFGWSMIAFFVLVIPLLSNQIAKLIPYEIEVNIGNEIHELVNFEDALKNDSNTTRIAAAKLDLEKRLNDLIGPNKTGIKATVSLVSSGEFNAFAAPGGRIYLMCGLVEAMDANELSAVLSHELSHVKNRDSMNAYVHEIAGSLLVRLVAGSGFNVSSEIAANMTGLDYSRGVESRADEDGVKMLMEKGYYAGGAPGAFDKFIKNGHGYSFSLDELFSTHPDPKKRKARLAELTKGSAGAPFLTPETFGTIDDLCRGKIKEW